MPFRQDAIFPQRDSDAAGLGGVADGWQRGQEAA